MTRVTDPADDRELLARARTGDVDAFAAFVRHHERRVRGVLFRMLDDVRDVEEATQDVFVQAWRALERFRGDAAPFTWLYRIAVNEALMRRRRKRLQTTELDESLAGASDPSLAAEGGELRSVVLGAIAELDFDLRAPLVLRDVEGLSNQEVAQVLDLTLAAAKARIHRARMHVRARVVAWEAGRSV